MLKEQFRVYHIPQVGYSAIFYAPVDTPEEGYKIMQVLSVYDLFQLQHDLKPDFSNACGLEVFDEDSQEWVEWYDDSQGYDINECFDEDEDMQDSLDMLFEQIKGV